MDAAERDTVELLDRWHAGDESALDPLLERNLDWITRHVSARLGEALRGKAETADLVQDAIVEMLRYGPRFRVRDTAQFRALLARIAENVLRGKHQWFHRERRSMAREKPLPADSVLWLDVAAASQTTPSQAAMREERDSWVRLAIELLPPADREVVILREWNELSFGDIAQRLALSEDAARMRFHRALGRLARTAKRLRDGDLDTALRDPAT